jgi:SAM-dependent methyltransferase
VSAYKSLKARWSNIETDACIAAMEFSKNYNTVKCAKRYTERVLTSLLLESPMIFRSYTKPLGYPGDYQIMEYYYKNSFEGKNVFAKIFHKLFVEHPLSTGVCTRKDFIVQLLVKEHERFINQNKIFPIYRVTNLGCGPARDIIDFIQHKRHWAGEIELTLIDQENEALKLAYNNCAQEISRWRSPAVLKGFNISFTQLLQDPEFLPIVDLQHFIFSTGLFDYLGDSHAQELVKWFYDRLEKEGLLAIANAAGPNNHFWSPEFILDWTLRYRNKNEMMCLANKLPSSADVKVVFEPTEAYYFLLVRKH